MNCKHKVLFSLVFLFAANHLSAIERYAVNDVLFIIGDNVNYRTGPNLSSESLGKLQSGDQVVVLQDKFDKSGDVVLGVEKKDWETVLTGRWTKIQVGKQVGYIFDLYLSKHDFNEMASKDKIRNLDTIMVPDYELYTRIIYDNGIIQEKGIGIEWSLEICMIPDFSFEEALLWLKPNFIDFKYGERVWTIEKDVMLMNETDGVSYRQLKIEKIGEYKFITILDGV